MSYEPNVYVTTIFNPNLGIKNLSSSAPTCDTNVTQGLHGSQERETNLCFVQR